MKRSSTLARGLLLGALALALSLGAARRAAADDDSKRSITDALTASKNYQTFLMALRGAGLDQTLRGAGPYTVFAPTDEAFAKLPPGTLASLMRDQQRLKRIIGFHVVPGQIQVRKDAAPGARPTLSGSSVTIGSMNGKMMVNGATVVHDATKVRNGLIYGIDTVLLPPGTDVSPR